MIPQNLRKSLLLFYIVMLLSKTMLAQYEKNARRQFYEQEWQNNKFESEGKTTINSDSTIDIKFYHLDVAIAVDSAYIIGNVYIKLESKVNNLNTLKLNLHASLTVDSITMNAQSFSHINDEIFVNLNGAFNSGDPVELKVYYHGIPILANNTKGLRYATHGAGEPIIANLSTPFLSHYWWPCKDGPGDKADSVYVDITIKDTTIAGYPLIAVSNGLPDGVDSIPGISKTFKWKHRYPIVPYYVMTAISNFRTISQTYTGATSSFPLVYYVFDANYANADTAVIKMPDAFDRYSQLYGDYPFASEKYGMTELGFYGAIENQTNTVINTIDPSYYYTFVHELAHQWFGDMITCKDWHHGWLNEGFATYSEALIAEDQNGFASYKTFMAGAEYYAGGTVYLPADTNPFNIFQAIIYYKGSYVLHMLRGVLGDTVFFNCLHTYASDPALRYNHATTEDFQLVCETVSGLSLQDFFDQWIYDEYYPKYKYNFTSQPPALAIYQQQNASNGWRSVFKMPVQVKFHFNTGLDTLITVTNDQQYQVYSFNFADSVTSVEIDPDNWILKNVEFDSTVFVGINEPSIITDFSVFPNPNNGHVQLLLNNAKHTTVSCQIINTFGQTVFSDVFNVSQNLFKMDLSQLRAGIYFLAITFDNKRVVKKIMRE